jgi:AcrR family transcriptional regulator
MAPRRHHVKVKRPYDASRRRAQARQANVAVLDAAQRLFFETGYAATTIASIATAAGVSVETIYKAFGGKPGLVRALAERALEGEGPVPAEQRSDAMREATMDPKTIVEGWGRLAAEVAPRISPLLLLVRTAAASDPAMEALRAELDEKRLTRMSRNAKGLHRAGHLRPGVGARRAGEVMWTYSSPELYELLVVQRRWSADAYGRFIAEALIAALLP